MPPFHVSNCQVWSWSVANITLTDSDKEELTNDVRDVIASATTSSALSQALEIAKTQVLKALEGMKG